MFLLIITTGTYLNYFFFFLFKCSLLRCLTSCLDFLSDPNCQLEDKVEDGEVLDCKKRPDEGEELEEEVVHSCDSCLQVFESLSDITEHKINQCQLTGKQYLPLCGFFHCSISNSHPLLLIFSLLSQLYYFCNWMLGWDLYKHILGQDCEALEFSFIPKDMWVITALSLYSQCLLVVCAWLLIHTVQLSILRFYTYFLKSFLNAKRVCKWGLSAV